MTSPSTQLMASPWPLRLYTPALCKGRVPVKCPFTSARPLLSAADPVTGGSGLVLVLLSPRGVQEHRLLALAEMGHVQVMNLAVNDMQL